MRRAERLFQIIQILRSAKRPVTAMTLAGELEVSKRTIYRDMAELISQRVPIDAATGFGYVMAPGYDMPPLMLTRDEVEALVLGAQWVMGRNDPSLATAARGLIGKIVEVIPEDLRPSVLEPSLSPRPVSQNHEEKGDPAMIRAAVREGRKLQIRYCSEAGAQTERVVWPVIVGYSDTVRMLIAWCELRADFRHFRTDRILHVEALGPYEQRPAALRVQWQTWRAKIGPPYRRGEN